MFVFRHFDSTSTPRSFYHNARENLKSSTHVDRVMARLRGAIESTSANSLTNRHSAHGPGVPPTNRQSKGKALARPPQPINPQSLNPQPVQPRVNLDDGDGFLKWAGIGNSATIKPSTKPIVSTPAQSQQYTPHTHPPSNSTLVASTNGVATQAQDSSTESLGDQGLMGSKWGPSPQEPVQQAIPGLEPPPKSRDIPAPQQLARPNTASVLQQTLTSHDVLHQQQSTSILDLLKSCRRVPVKIIKNDSSTKREGSAAMVKKNKTDKFFSLILTDSTSGNVLVDETVSHDALFEVSGSVVTYRAAQHTVDKPITWKVMFGLPVYAASFANFVILERQASGYIARATSDPGPVLPERSYELETSSYSAPDAIDTSINQCQKAEEANEHTDQTINCSQTHYRPGYDLNNVPATAAFAQTVDSENAELLISLGDGGHIGQTYAPPSTMNSDVFDLLEADDSDVITGLFGVLGGDDMFFENMKHAVVTEGGNLVGQISSDDLKSDQFYQSVLQTAVARYLSKSEFFTMLPEEYCAAYVQNKSRKIMDLAISRRYLSPEPSTSPAEENIGDVIQVEKTPSNAPMALHQEHKDINGAQIMSQSSRDSTEVEESQAQSTQDFSIKYSPESLLNLRSHAVPVKISEHPPRERRPTRVVAPHITTVKEWQSFSATESKSTTPVPETRSVSRSTVPIEVADVPKSNSQDSSPPILTSSEASRAAPAPSTANSWQVFAAAEDPKSSARDQSARAAVPATSPTTAEAAQEVESTASVSSTTLSTIATPQHSQHTDDALWAAILGSVGSSKSVFQPKPQVPKGNLRHHPSKSDINDRLAKDFSGLNLNTSVAKSAVEPATSVSEKSTATTQIETKVHSIPAPIAFHAQPLGSFTPAVPTAVPEQSLAAPKTEVNVLSTPESRSMPRNQSSAHSSTFVALTPASQAMQHKITAALKQPLVASPRLSSASSFSRPSFASGPMDGVQSQLKTTTDAGKDTTDASREIPPSAQVKAKMELKGSSSNGATVSSPAVMEAKFQGVSSTIKTEPSKNPISSVPAVDSSRHIQAAAEPAKRSKALDDSLNKVLKGAPGLSASKWADDSTTLHTTVHTAPRTYSSSFQPTQQAPYYSQGPPTQGYAPVMTTVLVPDGPGRWKEVTGMVKAGSIPLVAHAPMPQPAGPYVENVRPSSGPIDYSSYPAHANFPVRPNTFQHHSSFGSVNSESKINPAAPTFKPSPQRAQGSTPLSQRQPLSPSKNIQSQLQSRLNSSMTGPRMSYQGPQS